MKGVFKNREGITFLEIILALGISAIIIVVVSSFSSSVLSLGNLIEENLEVHQDLTQSFQALITDIRSAAPSALGGYAIEAAASTSFIFYSDINSDGLTDRVRYFLTTSTLARGVVYPTGTPLAYVTSSEAITTFIPGVIIASSSFEYFGSAATSTASPLSYPLDISDIRLTRITIVADVSSSTAPRPVTFTNTVTIRNLRSN